MFFCGILNTWVQVTELSECFWVIMSHSLLLFQWFFFLVSGFFVVFVFVQGYFLEFLRCFQFVFRKICWCVSWNFLIFCSCVVSLFLWFRLCFDIRHRFCCPIPVLIDFLILFSIFPNSIKNWLKSFSSKTGEFFPEFNFFVNIFCITLFSWSRYTIFFDLQFLEMWPGLL